MTFGSRARRPAPGPVLSTILALALAGAGCTGSPLRKARRELAVDPAPRPATPASLDLPEAARGVAPAEFEAPPLPSAPTPMLDAALTRAEQMQLEVLEELEPPAPPAAGPTPEPEPEPTPPLALDPPAPTPAPAAEPKRDPAVVPASAVATAPPPVTPVDPWREGLDALRAYARERAGEAPEGDPWAVREQLLGWVAGPELARAEAGPFWRALLAALEPAAPGSADAAPAGDRIREAVRALEDLAPLEITELQACRKVHGFGDYEAFDGEAFRPGQSLILYCEVAGLRYEPAEGQFRSRLASHVELVPEGSNRAAWSQALGTADDRCRRRRRDYYVNYLFALPSDLEPGRYELRLTQSDLVAGRATARALAVTIRP